MGWHAIQYSVQDVSLQCAQPGLGGFDQAGFAVGFGLPAITVIGKLWLVGWGVTLLQVGIGSQCLRADAQPVGDFSRTGELRQVQRSQCGRAGLHGGRVGQPGADARCGLVPAGRSQFRLLEQPAGEFARIAVQLCFCRAEA